ncbi:hypothetical protein F383_13505 [Gossypium arboreum]|uniref:Uncharacterized protein n=1 Tax=Gossypium arboreum TaxID=29729 RepID=A0A0B0NEQ9_GOSAR|nr:hypothetical protein F383_13505 [Gossypium arboreum]
MFASTYDLRVRPSLGHRHRI